MHALIVRQEMKILSVHSFWLTIGLCGCQSFSGRIEYSNASDTEVWVERIDGIDGVLGCGVLSPGTTAVFSSGRRRIPEQLTLYWSYDMHESDHVSQVPVDGVVALDRNSALILSFTEKGHWQAQTD